MDELQVIFVSIKRPETFYVC
uniref:Uncharacterized protein n=1 Tax=Anguilla anguilla TaxID=7936 RepID=A0A0E9UEZ8_ANGAN